MACRARRPKRARTTTAADYRGVRASRKASDSWRASALVVSMANDRATARAARARRAPALASTQHPTKPPLPSEKPPQNLLMANFLVRFAEMGQPWISVLR